MEALRIDGSTPESKSCIAFCMVASASRELNLGSDILICTINFQFGCNLEEERVQTRMARLGGWLASWGATLQADFEEHSASIEIIATPFTTPHFPGQKFFSFHCRYELCCRHADQTVGRERVVEAAHSPTSVVIGTFYRNTGNYSKVVSR